MTDIKVYEDVIERIEGKLRAMRRALKRERLMDGVSASRPHYHAVDVGARSMMADCTEIVALAAAGPAHQGECFYSYNCDCRAYRANEDHGHCICGHTKSDHGEVGT